MTAEALDRLDLGEYVDEADLVRKLQERRTAVIADLIALAELPFGLASVSRDELRAACHKELALCEEILMGLGEPFSAGGE